MIFDSHAHYDDKQFDKDRDKLLSSMKDNGIGHIVNVGANLDTTRRTLLLTDKYDFIYGAAGVHPCDVNELNETNFKEIEEAAVEKKIVAIGEVGLDYYWKETDRKIQKIWFERQIELAKKIKLPLIIHSRDACKDTYDILKASNSKETGAVIHCFSYGVETARDYLNMGFYLGIGGVITFNNAKKLREVVEFTPLDRILTETDCPYLSPVPFRGKRNSSLHLPYVIKEIAEIKKKSVEEITEITCQNAMKFYNIKE